MAKQTFVITTDKGEFEVDVDTPEPEVAPVDPSPMKEFLKTTKTTAGGFLKGLIPGALGAVNPINMLKSAVSIAQAAIAAGEDPGAAWDKAVEGVKGLPESVKSSLSAMKAQAIKDPEAFGKMLGETEGGLIAGLGASRLLPLAAKPAARTAGRAMTAIGNKPSLGLRFVGAGMGRATGIPGAELLGAALPEAVSAGGRALTKFGTETAPGEARMAASAGPAGGLRVPVKQPVGAPPTPQQAQSFQDTVRAELQKSMKGLKGASTKDLDKAIASASEDAATARAKSARLETRLQGAETKADMDALRKELADAKKAEAAAVKAQENATKLKTIQDRRAAAGVEAKPPSFSESVSAETPEGGRTSMSTRFAPPEEAGPTEEPIFVGKQQVSPEQAKKIREGMARQEQSALRVGAPRPTTGVEGAVDEELGRHTEAEAERMAAVRGTPEDVSTTPAGRSLEAERKAIEEEFRAGKKPVIDAMRQAVTESEPAPKVPVSSAVPPTRRRGSASPMSATPGLTVPDVESIGLNPRMKINTLSPEAALKILQGRQGRQGLYRTDAALSKLGQQMLENELEGE